jgi:hypothetical protein
LLLALSAAASAEDFSYDYLYLGYGNTDLDTVNIDGDGYTAGASLAFSDKVHGFADYETAGLDAAGLFPDTDLERYSVGVGYNTSMSDAVSMFARLSYDYFEMKVDDPLFGPVTIDDNGYGLAVGVRFAVGSKLELNGIAKYVDYTDLGEDSSIEVAALYEVVDALAVGLSADWSDDISTYTLTARLYFGK